MDGLLHTHNPAVGGLLILFDALHLGVFPQMAKSILRKVSYGGGKHTENKSTRRLAYLHMPDRMSTAV